MFTLAVNLVLILLIADIARAALTELGVWCWARSRPVRELIRPRRAVLAQSMIE